MVALGTLISAFWILSANSWMQTPAGFAMRDGRFMPADWWAIVFNPSFPYRFAHMVTARLPDHGVRGRRRRRLAPAARRMATARAASMFSMAMWMASCVAPVQAVVGDMHGLNTLEHQPAKIAAMEGHWETQRRRALDPVRPAGHGGGDQPLRGRRSRSSAA